MNMAGISDSVRMPGNVAACAKCGSTSRVGRGFCLNCLLQRGLETDTDSTETLEEVLAEVDVRDTEWRLGNYQILEEIGRGGMGVIYRARQRHSRRIVALKRVLGYHADSRETLARFRREAQAAASLDHPNILPIYEVSESDDGLPFFSMKFAPGGSLQEVGPALRNDPRQCVALVAKIARAVQHAHGKGILHRDLKPGNILLDGSGEPLVSDFGLAKWLDTTSDLTRTLTIFGTPGYIAPEQASGPAAQLKPAADVYSLGAILFDLLAGRPPFLGSHALSVIRQAAETTAPKLRSLSKVADRDLETICARCLEREPSARYRSAHDLAEDLERWLQGRPIIARPVSPPVRLWRWSKRNPKLAGSLAAVLILGVAGLGVAITNSRLSGVVRSAELAQRSVVVIPFEDLDDLSVTSKSARAASDALRAALTGTKGIRSSSTEVHFDDDWSAEEWKKVGKAAGARMVLGGSVRQRQGKQRITLHLIETASGQVVSTWLHEVTSDSTADFANASVRRISGFLNGTDTAIDCLFATSGNPNITGGTSNPKARGFYERGRDYLFRYNLTDQRRAIDSLQKATELDPGYGQAHAFLATACELRATTDPDPIWAERAEKAEAAALKHAPMLPETHRANAANLQRHAHRRAAIDGYLTAYELDPSDPRAAAILGHSYDALGRPDLAIPWYEKANRREKRDVYADNIASAWLSLGDYTQAETHYRTAINSRPDLPVGDLGLVTVALFRGDHEAARKQCQVARTDYKDNPQPLMMAAVIEFFSHHFVEAEPLYREALAMDRAGGVEFLGSVRFLSAIGFMRKTSAEGKALLEEARALDEKEVALAPESPERLYSLAATCAALDDGDVAIASLNKAVTAGWIDYRSMELDPRFDSIRSTQAFKDLLTRLTDNVRKMRRQQPSRKIG